MDNLIIKEVQSKRDLNNFIKFPDKLYAGNKCRATPLHTYERMILNQKKNPAFDHCEASYWLAYQDNKIVGRIAGIINWNQKEENGMRYGRFGWIDFIDNYDISAALFETVENWLKRKGVHVIQGPLGFSDMDMEGMLVEGFNELGTQATLYNYAYYPVHLEHHGYTKDVDWVQKEIKVPDKIPEKLTRVAKLVAEKNELRILKVNKAKKLIPYAKSMFYTLNAAFGQLYGFVPLTDKQIQHYIKQYFQLIRPEFVCFVLNKQDEVVGFGISMPSISKALIKAKGNLFPLGFIYVLKAINGKNDIIDMYLNGVRPDYHGKGVPAIYYTELAKAYIDRGIKLAITNPQLEHNNAALQLWKNFEQRTHITRRCYKKLL